MMIKIFRLYILFGLFFTVGVFVYADTLPLNGQQNRLFSEGVYCYKHKQYAHAKFFFDELAALHDRRAAAWLKKVAVVREAQLTKELQHQKRILERQARLTTQPEAKKQKANGQAELLAQDKKEKEEVMRQQAQEREEKNKQEKIIREENLRREELERQESQHQAKLNLKREALRKQLEEGIEAMYQDALSLYKRGDYSTAADRFKDVDDIFPGYKNSGQYMEEARQKSLDLKPQAATTPYLSGGKVSEALDLFDPNAK